MKCSGELKLQVLQVAVLVAALGASLGAQDALCLGDREGLGSPGLAGRTANLGGYSLTADGLEMYYDVWSEATGTLILMAVRSSTENPFETGSGVPLGPAVNTGLVYGPRVSPDGRFLYFSAYNRPGGGGDWDIWVASRSAVDASPPRFETAQTVPGLSTGAMELAGCVSPDGTFFFAHGSRWDLWMAAKPGSARCSGASL